MHTWNTGVPQHKKLIPKLSGNLSKNLHQVLSHVFCGSYHSCDLILISYARYYFFFSYYLILQFSFNPDAHFTY